MWEGFCRFVLVWATENILKNPDFNCRSDLDFGVSYFNMAITLKLFETKYIVYPDGKIFNIAMNNTSKTRLNEKGYVIVSLNVNDKEYVAKVHRLVAMKYIPNPNNYPQINHIDGIKTNNNIENLEWVDNKQNKYHAMKLLESKTGKRTSHAIFSMQEISNIRAMYKNKTPKTVIENNFNINRSKLNKILYNEIYKEI